MKNLFLLMILVCFSIFSCNKEPNYPGIPGQDFRYTMLYGIVVDSVSGQCLENVVIWEQNPFRSETESHSVTNDLGNFSLKVKLTPEDSITGKLFFFSKSNYGVKRLLLYPGDMGTIMDVKLNPEENDTISPFCIAMELVNDNYSYKIKVDFFFSEEVYFNEEYMQDLAQLTFRRKADICAASVSYDVYESQENDFFSTPANIRFGHIYQECDSCWNSYSYSYQKNCEFWTLESVKLLPWLCEDSAGNFLEEYNYISK